MKSTLENFCDNYLNLNDNFLIENENLIQKLISEEKLFVSPFFSPLHFRNDNNFLYSNFFSFYLFDIVHTNFQAYNDIIKRNKIGIFTTSLIYGNFFLNYFLHFFFLHFD